jgi:hypothetical protein
MLLYLINFCLCSVVGIREADHPIFADVPQISPAIRAAVDKMCFMAPFGTKTMFEQKVPVQIRRDFHKYIMRRHSHPDALKKFGVAWKAWLGDHQAELSDMASDDEDDDDEDDGDGDDDQPKRKKKFVSAFGAMGSDSDDDAEPTPPVSPRAAAASPGKAAASPGRAGAAGRRAQATENE